MTRIRRTLLLTLLLALPRLKMLLRVLRNEEGTAFRSKTALNDCRISSGPG